MLARMDRSMDALGTGDGDMPERQRTPASTVEWSWGSADDSESGSLLESSGFRRRLTIDAAAGWPAWNEDRHGG